VNPLWSAFSSLSKDPFLATFVFFNVVAEAV